jgi:predicted amidophosphoribosyltransferase
VRNCTEDEGIALNISTVTATSHDQISLDNETKKCPACAENIKLEAKKCRFCGEEIDPEKEKP